MKGEFNLWSPSFTHHFSDPKWPLPQVTFPSMQFKIKCLQTCIKTPKEKIQWEVVALFWIAKWQSGKEWGLSILSPWFLLSGCLGPSPCHEHVQQISRRRGKRDCCSLPRSTCSTHIGLSLHSENSMCICMCKEGSFKHVLNAYKPGASFAARPLHISLHDFTEQHGEENKSLKWATVFSQSFTHTLQY